MTNTPLTTIARLHAAGDISSDERDAAEIYSRMGGWLLARPAADGSAHMPQRTADGKWSRPLMRGQEILAAQTAATAAIRTDNRRRAVTLALVSREEGHYEPAALSCGLEDLCQHYWPKDRPATVTRKGVTLPRLKADELDATPERIAQAAAHPDAANDNAVDGGTIDGSRRIFKSPFQRMYDRRQLAADADSNESLYAAGVRYYQDWYYSGLSGLAAMDYGRVGTGDSSAAYMMPRTEREAIRREAYRDAVYCLDKGQRAIMDAVVLGERSVEDVARDAGGRLSRVRVEVKGILVGALAALRKHYDTPPGQQIRWRKAA